MLFGTEITPVYIIAQAVGFIAMGLGIVSYQSRRRDRILIFQILSNLCWSVQYLLLGGFSAVAANVIGMLRNTVYMFRGKYRFASSRLVPIISAIAFIVFGVITYSTVVDILPVAAMLIATVAFYLTNEQMIRILILGISLSWFTYGVFAGSIASMISDGMIFITILIAIIRYHKLALYEKTTADISFAPKSDEEVKETENNTV